MDTYIGTKIVNAEPMDEAAAFDAKLTRTSGSAARPGYKVVYEDGYTSWSPADTFERAYRRITPEECALIGIGAQPRA